MLWGRGMAKYDFYGGVRVFVRDDDFRTEGGGEALFAFYVQSRPEGGETAGFEGDGFDREVSDFECGGFAFEFGQFFGELTEPLVKR